MKITSVTFRANGPAADRFSHVHVEATASVGTKETPEQVMSELKFWVLEQLAVAKRGRAAIEEQITLDEAIAKKTRELQDLQALRRRR